MGPLHAPTVSVCIPTYRGVAHLGSAIDSVLGQTFADFELVIIDDNSPDTTSDLVGRYGDTRIRYIRNSNNLGPEGNWNKCLAEAKGKYFKLLPHDDVLMPTCLERQASLLEQDEHERVALVFCARTIIGPSDKVLRVRGYPRGTLGIIESNELVRRCMRYGTNLIGEPGAVMMRRKLALQIGSFDATHPYVIDLNYWFRLLLHGAAYYIPEPLAAFRVSRGSWSVALSKKQTTDVRGLFEKFAQNPDYSVKYHDVAIGRQMARVNNVLRLLFYRVVLKDL